MSVATDMATTAAERKRAERTRKREMGLIKVEIWRPKMSARAKRDVASTIQYMRDEVRHSADVKLDAGSAQELLQYFGAHVD